MTEAVDTKELARLLDKHGTLSLVEAMQRIDELERALEPFAVEYDYVFDGVPDGQRFWESNLRIGDFRRAAALLRSEVK